LTNLVNFVFTDLVIAGHQLIGSRRRICEENAEFSGAETVCRRKIIFFGSIEVFVKDLVQLILFWF